MHDKKLEKIVQICVKNDKIMSNYIKKSYFLSKNLGDLWDYFIKHTEFMHCDKISHRLKFLIAGHETILPKCYCGKDIRILNNKVSKYCSKYCADHSPEKAKKVSESKKALDKNVSNQKRVETMIKRYGVGYNFQREDIKEKVLRKSPLNRDVLAKLGSYQWLYDEYVIKDRTSVDIANELGIYYGTVIEYLRKHNIEIKHVISRSDIEKEITEFIESHGVSIRNNYVGVFDDKREVDIYIPDKKIAIEINGLYWHTEKYCQRLKHRNKKDDAYKKGIDLINITDWDWKNKTEIIQSIILNRLGLHDLKIPARKCQIISSIDTFTARQFFDKNHIKGFKGSGHYVGLSYNDDIVLMVAYDIRKEMIEISRECSKLNTIVIGGYNRLLKHIILTHKDDNTKIKKIHSYVDKDYFNGMFFKKNNWLQLPDTDVGYFWTDGTEKISRYQCQKYKKKENDTMHSNGFYRFYNSGNYRFVYMIHDDKNR